MLDRLLADSSEYTFKWHALSILDCSFLSSERPCFADRAIQQKYPCLADFATWMQHVWLNADLTPTGEVPDHRHGRDKYSGIEINFNAVSLPVIDRNFFTPGDDFSASSLLMEGVGVVELLFFPPEQFHARLRTCLRLGILLPVSMPTIAWNGRQYTELDIFEALCKELASACQRVEAMNNHLIYKMVSTIRFLRHDIVSHHISKTSSLPFVIICYILSLATSETCRCGRRRSMQRTDR
jgi:hypothetical protein